jgi:adenylate cyclase
MRPRSRRRIATFSSAWRRQVALGFFVGVIASALTTTASAVGLLEGIHASALDLLAWWKYVAPSPQIVIVAIDDQAWSRVRTQPIPRDYLGSVIRGARQSGARVIGVMVDLSRPTPLDQVLADAVGEAYGQRVPVVLSYVAARDPSEAAAWLAGPVVFRRIQAGFANDVVEADGGVVRHFRALLPSARGGPLPSFAFALVSARADRPPVPTLEPDGTFLVDALHWVRRFGAPEAATWSPLAVRVDQWERINFVGPARTFVTIPSNALAAAADDARLLPRNPLRDKIVLIGPTFGESGEVFATPKGQMSGVEIQANIAHTLLTRSWMTRPRWLWALVAQSVLCLVAAALFASLHPVEAGLMMLIAVAGGFVPLALLVYGSGDYWVDLTLPLLLVFVQVRAIDHLEQRRLQASFARYVSPEVVHQVLNSKDVTLRAEQREVSILFCDLRDSTGLAEKLASDELMRLLNSYFEMVTEAVFRHGGMINKFIGDGILAVYNAPLDVRAHADAAIQTALEIQAEMLQLNRRWGDWLATRLAVGVGIHTGQVICGNVGSALRLEYTIIGDPVNVAARVESLTKELNARVLVTAATRARLTEHYPLKPHGPITIRGRSEPIEIYEVT